MGGSWRQGLLNRIHGIGISLACNKYRETLETSIIVGRSGGMMMSIFKYINKNPKRIYETRARERNCI